MTLFSVLAALIADYFRPLVRPSEVDRRLDGYSDWLLRQFNTGDRRHAWLALVAGAAIPAVLAGMAVGLLQATSPPLAWAVSALVLYLAMGYRFLAMGVMDAVGALSVGDVDRARRFEAAWCHEVSPEMDAEPLARCGIRTVFRQALERLFSVLFWFVVLDVAGVVLYTLTRALAQRWQGDALFKTRADILLNALEWLPARGMAISFAVVGHFEHALSGWRQAAALANASNETVVEAAGAGALGVALGADSTAGRARPSVEYLEGAVNLVWRALLLWLGLLGLFWLGGV